MGYGGHRTLKETSFYNNVSRINTNLEFVFRSILENNEIKMYIH